MKSLFRLFVPLVFVLIYAGCDNEIDVNAPWEEVTIAYGLLDIQDSVHYIKVNKAYQNYNRNARDIAANNPDSIYHNQEISVKLQAMTGGQVQETYDLRKDTLHSKEPGLFSYPDHIMYRNVTPFHPNPNFTYRLKIDSLKQEEPVTATTPVVTPPLLTNPRPNPNTSVRTPPFGIIDEVEFIWKAPSTAHFFEMHINTIYSETNTNTGESHRDTVNWTIFRFSTSNDYDIQSNEYFEHIGRELEAEPNVTRPVDSVRLDIVLSAGGETLYQYYRVNRPSISIVQKSPNYTNINNGRGLFSSKTTVAYPGKLADESLDSLISGRYTNDLNFSR